jgi:hypothetical protein
MDEILPVLQSKIGRYIRRTSPAWRNELSQDFKCGKIDEQEAATVG